ncbi:MAG: trehalose-phosphatase [Actinomycetota bacterium]|nr:trehalose-phosphatase [Actinomycetota bacterium]
MASSPTVAELARPFRTDPAGSAVFSDFDGTLAEIVDDPSTAAPHPGAVDLLARLAGHYGRVGVISGRPAAFLLAHLGGRGIYLSGLYGLESVSEVGEVGVLAEAERWRAVVEEVAVRAKELLADGATVERKGLSVTVHYRTRPGLQDAVAEWAGREAAATGLVADAARMSYELRPPVRRDKGSVLAEAGAGRDQVCFLGDDRGDLSAFDALDRLAAAGASVVRVAVTSPEAPEELLARADLVVDGPEGSLSFLRALL